MTKLVWLHHLGNRHYSLVPLRSMEVGAGVAGGGGPPKEGIDESCPKGSNLTSRSGDE